MKFRQKALPHIIALIIFAAVSAIFFYPQYQDKALRQGDMVQVNGMQQDILEHQAQHGEHPQWAGRMFGGMPAYAINMNYDGRWIKYIADHCYILGQPASFLFIAMASFYLMLLLFGVNPWIGIIGGLAYGLSTYFPIIIEAGHITKMMALAWIPAIIGAVYYAYRRSRLLGAAITGILLAIEISTSHYQITYYFAFVLMALVINEFVQAFKQQKIRSFVLTSAALLGAVVLAVGANLVQLYYMADYAEDTTRGKSELTANANHSNTTSGLDKDYATNWSYGKAETFNMFIPNFMGGSSSGGFSEDGEVAEVLNKYQSSHIAPHLPGYFGSQPMTSGPVYLGAVMVFLMVLGLFLIEGRNKWWIVAVSVLALMLAWGRNMMWLTDIFLDYFPLYNKFRTVSMILVVLEWSVPFLAVLTIQRLSEHQIAPEKIKKSLTYAFSITVGFALLSVLAIPNFMDFSAANDTAIGMPEDVIAAMRSERASLVINDSLRSMLFVVLTAVAIWMFNHNKIKITVLVIVIAVLSTFDLFNVDRRFVKAEDFQPKQEALAIKPTDADKQILQDKSNYRVANFTVNPFSDATTSYFHRSIGGYHAAKLRRYQDVIDAHLSQNNLAVYDMLNTKYFIVKDGVQINHNAAGNVWFVDRVQVVASPDEEIAALGASFDPKQYAVVDKRFENEIPKNNIAQDSTARIEMTDYKVNAQTYKYSAPNEGVVVFSEIYYPKGWTAYIDGKEAAAFRADYILRAMAVPAGDHTIEWRFAAPKFDIMVNVTRASSVVLLLMLLAGIGLSFYKKNE